MIDFQNLTIGDLTVLEDHGVTLDDMAALEDAAPTALPSARLIAATRFLQLRATNPAATWEDALASKFSDLEQLGAASPES